MIDCQGSGDEEKVKMQIEFRGSNGRGADNLPGTGASMLGSTFVAFLTLCFASFLCFSHIVPCTSLVPSIYDYLSSPTYYVLLKSR